MLLDIVLRCQEIYLYFLLMLHTFYVLIFENGYCKQLWSNLSGS